jgi:hypothetical protein
MFQKMYVDDPDNWQEVSKEQVRRDLANYYKDVDEVMGYIQLNGKARTPFAFYRWILKVVQQ